MGIRECKKGEHKRAGDHGSFQWILISSALRDLPPGLFCPQLQWWHCSGPDFPAGLLQRLGASLWPRREDSEDLETRGALAVELWERIALTTNYLLLKRGKYVTPSKGDEDSKGNTSETYGSSLFERKICLLLILYNISHRDKQISLPHFWQRVSYPKPETLKYTYLQKYGLY